MSILQALINTREVQSFLIYKILGSIFVLVGGLGGVFFLFQALNPLVGYFESGAIVCGIVGLGGIGLLMHQGRNLSVPEEITQKLLTSVKELDVEKALKDNALSLSLFSLGLGIVLSQIKGVKSLSAIYKTLK